MSTSSKTIPFIVAASSEAESSTRIHPATLLLGLSMFTTGFSGLVVEYVLATTATYIMGNSIYYWSIIIAVMMAMMGVGGWLQKLFSDKGLIEKFAGIEVSLALLGGFAPLMNYWAFAHAPELYSFVSLGLVAFIGLLIGFEIPLVMRINDRYCDSLKDNAAWIFSLDYVGSFIGAVIWINFLLPKFPLTELSFMVSGANFVVAAITLFYFSRTGAIKSGLFGTVILVLTGVALIGGYANNRAWSVSLEQRFYDDAIIHSETSKFQHIVLTEDGQTGNVQLWLNGKKQFSSLDENIYHEFLVHPAMAAAERRNHVLILGGGDGCALREVLKYDDVESITMVDLDDAVVKLASTNEVMREINDGAFDSARVTVITDPAVQQEDMLTTPVFMPTDQYDENGAPIPEKVATVAVLHLDASIFLDVLETRFDVIIIDFPDPGAAELVKLYSKESFSKIKSRLAPHGVISIQSTSPYHAKDAYLCIGRTMNAAGLGTIPYHQNVPSFGEWGWYLGFHGSKQREKVVENSLGEIEKLPVKTTYLTPDTLRASKAFPKGWLDSDFDRVNTLSDPVLLSLYLDYAWKVD